MTTYNIKQYETGKNLNARIKLHEKYSTNKEGFHEWVFSKMGISQNDIVLECGVGPGALWFKNKDKVLGKEVYLLDRSEGMLTEAKMNIGDSLCTEFHYMAGDVQSLPFESEKFDIVIANHMLYHVEDIDLAIQELYRVLKKGGKLISSTFGQGHLRELNDLTKKYVVLKPNRTSDRFTLENGCYRILKVFGNVSLYVQDDGLEVTDSSDLVDYIMSGSSAQEQLVGEKFDQFNLSIEELIKEIKVFRVKKEAGVFIAKKE